MVPTDGDPAVMFPCACWLAEDVWDSKTERELLPGKAVKRPESRYLVNVLLYMLYDWVNFYLRIPNQCYSEMVLVHKVHCSLRACCM